MPNLIDSTGLTRVRYQDLRVEKAEQFRNEFGQDIKTDVQSGFGQAISIATQFEDELISFIQLMLTAFDPNAAQGVLLSRLAIIMNKRRNPAVNSTATITITADGNGATIPVGFIVESTSGVQFQTTTTLVIAPNSSDDIEVTALESGAIAASAGTITEVKTPVLGVATVTNALDAVVGRLEESDAELRARCLNTSSAINSTIIGIDTAVREVDGVTYAKIFENKSDLALPNGQPPHSIFPIIEGGADSDIAEALVKSIAAGIDYAEDADIPTVTIMSGTYTDVISGQTHTAHWARPVSVRVYCEVTITELNNYPADGATRIKTAINEWVAKNAVVGEDFYASFLYCAINSVGGLQINTVFVGLSPAPATLVATMGIADRPDIAVIDINVTEL